jgi:phospholipase C
MKPGFSIPAIPDAPMPPQDSNGNWIGREQCGKDYLEAKQPSIPYGKQGASTSLATEQGFKRVRGQLTEGRYLTPEMNGYALTNPDKEILLLRLVHQTTRLSIRGGFFSNRMTRQISSMF